MFMRYHFFNTKPIDVRSLLLSFESNPFLYGQSIERNNQKTENKYAKVYLRHTLKILQHNKASSFVHQG